MDEGSEGSSQAEKPASRSAKPPARQISTSEFERGGSALFVHDFITLDLRVDSAINALTKAIDAAAIRNAVRQAWKAEVRALDEARSSFPADSEPSVEVWLGQPRWRHDAIVIPVTWHARSGEWLPPLEADLEVAAFGTDRSHLHILGRSELPADKQPLTQEASLHHRFTVALVRHVLVILSERIVVD